MTQSTDKPYYADSASELAVGRATATSGDWSLNPGQHAGNLKLPDASALRDVLERTPTIKSIIAKYEVANKEAKSQQEIYRGTRRRLKRIAVVAALFGMIVLVLLLFPGQKADVQIVGVVGHVIAILYIVWTTRWLAAEDPRRRWLQARAEAEHLRSALFSTVVAAEPTEGPREGLPLLPLQLAYFRRYQLDVQLKYFSERSAQLALSGGMPKSYTIVSLIVAALAVFFAVLGIWHFIDEMGANVPPVLFGWVGPQSIDRVAFWGFASLGLSTVYAFLVAQHEITEDQRNAARYRSLYSNLEYIARNGYEAARLRAENGDKIAVRDFAGLVQQLMLAEQREWISIEQVVEGKDKLISHSVASDLARIFPAQSSSAPAAKS